MSDSRSSQRAGTGVWLGTPSQILEWQKGVNAPRAADGPSAMDWFVRLEALSVDRSKGTNRAPVTVARLASSIGRSRNILDEGAVFTAYQVMRSGLGDGATPLTDVRPQARLYQQARMATFLPYRQGFCEVLDAVPFTAEAAVHGYMRVLLEWARRWPGLTVSVARERASAEALRDPAMRRGRSRIRFAQTTRLSLPLVVEQDIRALVHAAELEASEVASTQVRPIGDEAAVLALLDQITVAASRIVEDETLTSLTATNIARLEVNDALGGALLRVRMRPRDGWMIESSAVEEIRRWLMHPRDGAVAEGRASLALAQLEAEFASLGFVRRVLAKEDDDD